MGRFDEFLTGGVGLLWTVERILKYALWLEQIDPGFLYYIILVETGEDWSNRDLAAKLMKIIEIFGMQGAARIVGCP
jgi:hypothetical protein